MSPRRVGDLSHWFTRHQLGNAMNLYEFAPTRSIRVRWTLQQLGVDFEAITVNLLAGEHRSPAFLKINPAGKLPVLVDDDVVLTESVAIVLYLAEKYRDQGLIPIDLQQRAQMIRWLLFTTRARAAAMAHCPPYIALSGEQAAARRIGACARRFCGHGEGTGRVHERSKIRRRKQRDRRGLGTRLHARLGQARERAQRAAAARSLYGRDVRAATCADAHQGGLRQHQALSSFLRHAHPFKRTATP